MVAPLDNKLYGFCYGHAQDATVNQQINSVDDVNLLDQAVEGGTFI